MRRSSYGLGRQRQSSESGSVSMVGSSGGVPAFGGLNISAGVIIVLLEVKTDDFVDRGDSVQIGPRNGDFHGVAAGYADRSVKDAGSVLESGQGGVAVAFDELAVVGVVGCRFAVVGIEIQLHGIIRPRIKGVVLEGIVQDLDSDIEVFIVPKRGENGGVVVGSGDCPVD